MGEISNFKIVIAYSCVTSYDHSLIPEVIFQEIESSPSVVSAHMLCFYIGDSSSVVDTGCQEGVPEPLSHCSKAHHFG